MRLYIDFETWSSVPIRRGTDVYMNHAKPLLCAYAIDDGPVKVIDFTEESDWDIHIHEYNATEIYAHNAYFDRMVTKKLLGIQTPIEKWRCSQAQALLHGLPGGLDGLCEVLKVPTDIAKIKDGKRLIKKFCCKKTGFVKDHEWPVFIQYAINDITAMRAAIRLMPAWNYKGAELELWQCDQNINNRGFHIDRDLAENCVAALAAEKERLAKLMNDTTGGHVGAGTQRDKLLTYICEQQGVFLPDLRAATIAEALDDERIDEGTKYLLRLRLEASKTSGAKYKRVLECVGSEDRLRGTLQFSGAARTARWAGRTFQPQNLPRPTMHPADIRHSVELFRTGKHDIVPFFAGINEAASNTIRGLIVAEPGKTLYVADYAAIEGRVNAWLAGETWKVKAFREGQDLYKLIYANGFSMDVSQVTKGQRQIGKVMELALGYGGGVGAFLSMAAGYGMDLDELGRTVPPSAKALEAWETALKKNQTYGLSKEVYVACDTLKIGYRKGNPEITKSWYQYEDAVRKVIESGKPQDKVQVGRLMFDCNGSWLRIQLPSGRFLVYASPAISSRGDITYFGWHNKRWIRTKTYGGKICENVVQAISRDLLGAAIQRVEKAGYPIVLHVHDEIIAEAGATKSLAVFIDAMATNPPWAAGLPLKAEGFKATRYEK